MNCEKDSASCWTVVMRQRRRKNVSSSRHSESSRGSAIMCPSDANFKKNDRDSTELRLQEVDHDTVSSPFGNLERSDYSDVVRELLCEVSRLKEQVQDSKWWHELLKLLFSHGLVCLDGPSNVFGYWKSSVEQQAYSRKRVGKLICYGLGSFENSAISRYQLALAKLLQECCVANVKTDHCGSWYSCSSVYDPVMSAVDIELCTLLGFVQAEPTFQLSSKHVSCERLKPISVVMEEDFCKLFFMPHCGRSLYNTVLKENWTRNRLHKVIILGNSFSFYQTFGSMVDVDSYLGLASRWMKELKCSNAQFSPLYEAFNDLSVHIFPTENLPPENDQVWTTAHKEITLD